MRKFERAGSFKITLRALLDWVSVEQNRTYHDDQSKHRQI